MTTIIDVIDYHMSVTFINKSRLTNWGLTIGPWFLSIDKEGDIWWQIVAPPKGWKAPLMGWTRSWRIGG